MNAMPGEQWDAPDLKRWSSGLIAAGLAALVLGAVTSADRLWGNLLLVAYLLAGLGLGGAFFLAFHGVTGARWSRPLLPAARSLAGTLPLSALATGALALAGLWFYPWAQGEVAHGPTFWFKNAWLTPQFFGARSAVYVCVWAVVGRWMGSPRSPGGAGRSGLVLVLLGVSVSLAGFDWIMSLEPLWFSTMFGLYQFAGILVSGLAALVVVTAWLKRAGQACGDVHEHQLHDLGKLLFGFSCFWMYIWFSQYMLIWYVNISEESVYFIRRTQGLWGPLMLLNLALNWGIPFVVLLPRPAKRSWRVMVRVALVILAGRWVDLYLMVLPPLVGDRPVCGWPELGGLLLAAGVAAAFLEKDREAAAAAIHEADPAPAPAG